MYEGNWKCSGCGGAITSLPFQPRSESGLTCRTCYAKSKNNTVPEVPEMSSADEAPDFAPIDAGVAGEPMPADDGFADAVPVAAGEKPKFEGNWQCASCNGAITSLPFQPRSTENLKCLDCFEASKG